MREICGLVASEEDSNTDDEGRNYCGGDCSRCNCRCRRLGGTERAATGNNNRERAAYREWAAPGMELPEVHADA